MNLRSAVSALATLLSTAQNRTAKHSPGKEAETHSAACPLLPTPRATDGSKGSPRQRGSKGDLTLPSAAHQITHGAPTPTPFTAGPPSPDATHPGQPTLWDDSAP